MNSMNCDFLDLAVAGVKQLSPYRTGKPIAELQRELGVESVIKLASNENPLGPSQAVLARIQQELGELTRYPDGNGFLLKQALAEKLAIAPNQITLGNGSNDVLDLVARCYLRPGDEAVFSEHAFAVYYLVTMAVGANPVISKAANWGHDLEAMANAITDRTKVVFIANPNNPTGTWFEREAWEQFLGRVPASVLVVLDEAYYEYAMDQAIDGLGYLASHPNVIVTRTFSKAYGLAALRVGYAISNPQVADILNRVRHPFNVNSLALAAAEAALADEDYLVRSCQLNREGLVQLTLGLEALGLEYIPSIANFVTVHVPIAGEQVYEDLLREGVIVRPIGAYGLPNALRVSVGLAAENQRFLTALATVLKL